MTVKRDNLINLPELGMGQNALKRYFRFVI